MAKIIIVENQSVLDVVTQYLGTLEASFAFCIENNISLTDDLTSNEKVEITKTKENVSLVSDYFAEKKKDLATGYPLIFPDQLGIGTMTLEQTFIVD
jgi:hypothetical protein